jgi:hypothetical protein
MKCYCLTDTITAVTTESIWETTLKASDSMVYMLSKEIY